MRPRGSRLGFALNLVIGLAVVYWGVVNGVIHHAITLSGKRGAFTLSGNQALAFGLFAVMMGLFLIWLGWITQIKGIGLKQGTSEYQGGPASLLQILAFSLVILAVVGLGAFIGFTALHPDTAPESGLDIQAPIVNSAKSVWRVIADRARSGPSHKIPAFDTNDYPAWWAEVHDPTVQILPNIHYHVVDAIVGKRLDSLKHGAKLLTLDGPEVTRAFGIPWSLTY